MLRVLLCVAVLGLATGTPHRTKRTHEATHMCSDELADVIFVLDSSGSIKQNNWDKVLEFVNSIVGALNIGEMAIQIGVTTFGNKEYLEFDLNAYHDKDAVMEAVNKIKWRNENTNTSAGIRYMNEHMFQKDKGDRSYAPNIAFVMTDGVSTFDHNLTIPEAVKARKRKITIFAIGVGSDIDRNELVGIANSPEKDFVFNVTSFDTLSDIMDKVVEGTRFCICTEENDLVFALDASGSIGYDNFDTIKNFIEEFIHGSFNVEPSGSRIGMVTFSDFATLEFELGDYMNISACMEAIAKIKYRVGTTNTAAALKLVREEMFHPNRGGRNDRRHILVIFTDGGSNDFKETVREAALAKLAGIEILVVGITSWVNMVELNAIASDPDDMNVFMVSDFEQLKNISVMLRKALCADLDACYSNPCQNGGQCVKMINNYYCICPDNFAGWNCEYPCLRSADVAFMVDASSSIGVDNYYKVLAWVTHVAAALSSGTGGDRTRVAIETFSHIQQVAYNFMEHLDRKSLMMAGGVEYLKGTTDTAKALNKVVEMFSENNGGRLSMADIAVLITDGRSDDTAATFQAAHKAHEAGVHIMSLAVNMMSDPTGQRELRSITSDPDDLNLINLKSFEDLLKQGDNISMKIMETVCNNQNECASNPCQGGATCIDGRGTYTCLCPRGRTGARCERLCDGDMDIILAIDASGSIRENRFETLKSWAMTLVDDLEIRQGRTHLGLLTFSSASKEEFTLVTYTRKEDMKQAIERLDYYRGKTNLAAAIRMMRNMFSANMGGRQNSPNIGILLTDGAATMEVEMTLPEAIQARMDGVHIMIVSPEASPSLEFQGIASDPDDANIHTVKRFSDLHNIRPNVVAAFCNDVDECASNPCRNGGRCVDGLKHYVCLCSERYTGRTCERECTRRHDSLLVSVFFQSAPDAMTVCYTYTQDQCTRRHDIVLILDSSGSTATMFSLALLTAKHLVHGLNFNLGRTRLGVMTFSDEANIKFHLNEMSTREEALNAIAFLHEMGKTNIADALTRAYREMFTAARGDRSGDDNIIIIMTDGFSNINHASTAEEAKIAKDSDIHIMTIGLGDYVNNAELENIATHPASENTFYLEEEAHIERVAEAVLDKLCQ